MNTGQNNLKLFPQVTLLYKKLLAKKSSVMYSSRCIAKVPSRRLLDLGLPSLQDDGPVQGHWCFYLPQPRNTHYLQLREQAELFGTSIPSICPSFYLSPLTPAPSPSLPYAHSPLILQVSAQSSSSLRSLLGTFKPGLGAPHRFACTKPGISVSFYCIQNLSGIQKQALILIHLQDGWNGPCSMSPSDVQWFTRTYFPHGHP